MKSALGARQERQRPWDQVCLKSDQFLGLIEDYAGLLERQTNTPEVWRRLDRAHERLNDFNLELAQKSIRIESLERQIQALESERNGRPEYTYSSAQHTSCAICGKDKHTPLRLSAGYVCLTCIDKLIDSLRWRGPLAESLT